MRAEKTLLLDEIREKIDGAKAIVLASYNKLEPNLAANFRNALRKQGGGVEVVKKRILVKAAQESGVTLDVNSLEGHIALFYAVDDPVATTKTIFDFTKDNEDLLKILGGKFEGQMCSAADVEQIAKLPSKDEMRAQFLGLLEAPMSQTLATMEALLTCVMHCLANKSEQTDASA
jgi:large subunit ribosomal protein L10